jgi:hypothetical protein
MREIADSKEKLLQSEKEKLIMEREKSEYIKKLYETEKEKNKYLLEIQTLQKQLKPLRLEKKTI